MNLKNAINKDDILIIQFEFITKEQINVIKKLNINPFLFKKLSRDEYLDNLVEEYEDRDMVGYNDQKKILYKNLLNIYQTKDIIFFEVGNFFNKLDTIIKYKVYLDPFGRFISNGILECLLYRNKTTSDYQTTFMNLSVNKNTKIENKKPNTNKNIEEGLSVERSHPPYYKKGGKPNNRLIERKYIQKNIELQKNIEHTKSYLYNDKLDLYFTEYSEKKDDKNYIDLFFIHSGEIYPLENFNKK